MWALWSEPTGAYARRGDLHGRPLGAARRLGAACAGGIAAAIYQSDLLIACLRPGDRDRGRQGALTVYRLGESMATLGGVGPIGAESRDPSVAVDRSRAVIGWRNADVFVARARLVEISQGSLGEPSWLSTEENLSSAPSLTFHRGRLIHAWTESWVHNGSPVGQLLIRREGLPPRPSLTVHDIDVHTFLTADASGPMVAVRDTRPRGARHRSFIGRLDDQFALDEEDLESPGRADAADGHPMLVPCAGHVFSVATRRSSREVTMVTIRRLNAALEPVEGEHQIYEYHARFVQAVGVCVQERVLLLVGERQTEIQPHPRLTTYELVCGPGRRHERTPSR